MIRDLLNHYFKKEDIRQRIVPLGVDVLSPDYYLYLYAGRDKWFVVVEADYLFMADIPRDIEASFPVKVNGWRTLTDYQKKTGKSLLLPDVFKNQSVNDSDQGSDHYSAVVLKGGTNYALLIVEPNPGVSEQDFALTFYTDIQPGQG